MMLWTSRVVVLVLLALVSSEVAAWTAVRATGRGAPHRSALSGAPRARARPVLRESAPRVATTANLDTAATQAFLRAEVAELLNREWMEQECHSRIAATCARAYAEACHANPRLEVSAVLIAIADSLLAAGPELFDEAFVGPYDVANMCADLLMHLLGMGADCECSVAPTGVGHVAMTAAMDQMARP